MSSNCSSWRMFCAKPGPRGMCLSRKARGFLSQGLLHQLLLVVHPMPFQSGPRQDHCIQSQHQLYTWCPNFHFFFDKLRRRHKKLQRVENAQERGIIHRDRVHLDTHPAALREVAHLHASTVRITAFRVNTNHARARLWGCRALHWSSHPTRPGEGEEGSA